MKYVSSKYSSTVAMLAVIPCLFAAEGLLGSLFLHASNPPEQSFTNLAFPEAALPTRSGYFTVNDTTQARMFYAFYEALDPPSQNPPLGGLPQEDVPIVLWLQGGPGCSSMTGNFYEFGPWHIGPDMVLHKNNDTWNQKYGLLFIDNPVGTGFSIAENDQDIPSDQQQVVTQLFTALTAFFGLDPTYRTRPFYVGGESYGGKYVPALGYYIMQKMDDGLAHFDSHRDLRQHQENVPFRLGGLFIGNGLTHPIVQVQTHGDTAYSFGLIDKLQKIQVDQLAKEVVALVEKHEWYAAYSARTALVDWITSVTGLATPLDMRRRVPYHCSCDGTDFLALFLNQKSVKDALMAEAGAHWVSCNPRVRTAMANDTMKSVKWMVEKLLPRIPLLLYQGIYDMKDGVACNEEWMQTLAWDGTPAFFATPRSVWRVNDNVAGYWRTYDTLSHVVVMGAGHLVPADQGLHSLKMMERWIGQHPPPPYPPR